MNKFYCYFWLREDGTPYYVGKGTRHRAYTKYFHCSDVPKDKSRIIIQYYNSEEEALEAEVFFIEYFGRLDLNTGILRNLTNGGDNPPRYKGKNKKAQCHPDRKHKALGLCQLCYKDKWRRTAGIPKRELKTHCIHGHPLDDQNTYILNGVRRCKRCMHRYYINRKMREQ
jgi:hypothetical protein